MRLLIVESPNKIKKIRGFLPKDFHVAASIGHIRDLPITDDGSMGVTFGEDAIEPHYVVTKQDVVAKLKREARQAESIWLATDPDREGEAIAWHVAACLGPERRYHRVAFQSITKQAVAQALQAPRSIDQKLVDAQQARRVLDRVVGWMVSPVLRRALGKEARSAGRVQSVALRIVAEREEEIRAFDKKDFFVLEADFGQEQSQRFTARLTQLHGQDLGHRLASTADAQDLADRLRPGPWRIDEVQRKTLHKQPPPPFTTSTAQQAASVRLKLGPKETMAALQRLFESGHITYHRTDSVALAPEAIEQARTIIRSSFGTDHLPDQPRIFATRNENAQEAHEAIRPTHPEGGADAVHGQDAALYRLIWERFIACQMAAAVDDTTTYRITSAGDSGAVFTAKGVVVVFDGWRRLSQGDATDERKREQEAALPPQETGDILHLHDLRNEKRSTKPPARYTQASLIKKLEKEGVGRPSTYAAIMSTLLGRHYVLEKKRKLHATDLGIAITDWLRRQFAGDFIELQYTAGMEADLDGICSGQREWQRVVFGAAGSLLERARAAGLGYNPLAGETRFVSEVVEDLRCPQCESPMRTRSSRFGTFYGCTRYPDCKGTRPGPEDAATRSPTPATDREPTRTTTRTTAAAGPPAADGRACPVCGGAMYLVMGGGEPFYSCRDYPRCTGNRPA
ncbi:MAG: type I DNA topoisomerase [Planctomycetota bacterium]